MVQHNVCISTECLYPYRTLNIVLLLFCCAMIRPVFKNERCEVEETCNGLDNQDAQAYSCATKKSRWLTVVFRDLDENEAQELIHHKKSSALSWSHAIHDRDHYKDMLKEVYTAKNAA